MDGALALSEERAGGDSYHLEAPGGYSLIAPGASVSDDRPLGPTGDGILGDGTEEYPVVDGIPYLIEASTRPGLEHLRERACAALRAGDERAALRLLLRDQDRFSPTPPPSDAAVDELIDRRDELSLREAMALLNYGPVADYFAHRWSSPTFQSGLALLERAALPSRPVVEVACGIGHFLRVLEGQGYATVGIDIVFSKLWLARHFLGVEGVLVCGDIERSPVLAPGTSAEQAGLPHTVLCHDAFYFFERKREALTHLLRLSNRGTVVLGHVHTHTDEHEAGFAERLADYRTFLPAGERLLDDAALARTYLTRETCHTEATERSTAFSTMMGRKLRNVRSFVPPRASLRLNPLLTTAGIGYPSEGWRREFEADSERLGSLSLAAFAKTPRVQALVRSELAIADLSDAEATALYRHRVLLDLPARW